MMLSADGTALVHARRLDHDFCPAVPKTPRKKPHHSSVFIVKRNTTGTTLTLGCNPTAPQIDAALGTATATDNCTVGTPTASDSAVTSSGCGRSQMRTWNVSDA